MELPEKSMLSGKRSRNILVVSVIVILLSSIVLAVPLSFEGMAEEDEEYEAPEWKEGDRWEYESRGPAPGAEGWIKTTFTFEVLDENYEVEPYDLEDGSRADPIDTYLVEETQYVEDEEISIQHQYTKENLIPAYHHEIPDRQPASYWYPPIPELDFPLRVGNNWTSTENIFYEVDPETGEPEMKMEMIKSEGRVEDRVTKNIGGDEVEAIKVNFSYMGGLVDEDSTMWRRDMIYYSPEVKNIIRRERFETRAIPDEEIPEDPGGDFFVGKEGPIGNETLTNYELQEREDEDVDPRVSLPNAWQMLGIVGLIVVGLTSIHYFKRWRAES